MCADDLEVIDPAIGQVHGAAVDLRFADISQVRNGKIVAYHTYYDRLGLLTQLGFDGSELMLPFERTTSSFGRLGSERDEIGN